MSATAARIAAPCGMSATAAHIAALRGISATAAHIAALRGIQATTEAAITAPRGEPITILTVGVTIIGPASRSPSATTVTRDTVTAAAPDRTTGLTIGLIGVTIDAGTGNPGY